MKDLPNRLARHLRALYPAREIRRVVESARLGNALPFGREWCRKYLPHYFAGEPADFHAELFADLSDLHRRRGRRKAVIAPREGAKSTVITLAYVLYCAVEAVEPFTLILSDSSGQASEHLVNVRTELEVNPALAIDYPAAVGRGPVWRQDRIQLRNGAAVAALGTRKRVRGRKSRQARPSLVVFDDVESLESIASPTQRTRAWLWATREVMPAGSATTNFLSVGSALHREAVAVRLGQLPGWTAHTYRAVKRWPDRVDLWLEWERLATNLADPKRGETADAFYAANRAEMDRGAEVYWPSRWPLAALMKRRAEIGGGAFDTEYQGVPGTVDGTEWPPEYFDWPGFWFDDWPKDLVLKVQTLDPSKGVTAKPGDYQAHVTAGLGRDGTVYLDAELRREPDYVARAVDIASRFLPNELVAESNNTMGLILPELTRQLAERAAADRPVLLNYSEVAHSLPKLVRMRGLTGYLSRRQIRVRNTVGGRMMVDQMRDVPNGEFDDAPDAAATAVRRLEELTAGA